MYKQEILRRVKTVGTEQFFREQLYKEREQIKSFFGIELNEISLNKIAAIGSYMVSRKDSLQEFSLDELSAGIKTDTGIDVAGDELRKIVGILMGVEKSDGVALLDIYSEIMLDDGTPSGKFASRNAVIHKNGLLHGGSNLAIFKIEGGQVFILLQRRSPAKFLFPGRDTLSACGHIDPGMDSFNTAIKEAVEEISSGDLRMDAAVLSGNIIRIGEELEYPGYVKQYSFEYQGDDFIGKVAQIRSMLEQGSYLDQTSNFNSIFFDSFQDKNGKKWVVLYTLDSGQETRLDEVKAILGEDSSLRYDASPSNSPYNREKKSFYLSVLREGDPNAAVIDAIIQSQSGVMGGGEVEGFRWVEFGALLEDFRQNPQNYTDAFLPFFSDPGIVAEIEAELGPR